MKMKKAKSLFITLICAHIFIVSNLIAEPIVQPTDKSIDIKNLSAVLLKVTKKKKKTEHYLMDYSDSKEEIVTDSQIAKILHKIPGISKKAVSQKINFENDIEYFFSLSKAMEDPAVLKDVMENSTFFINGQEIPYNGKNPVYVHQGKFTFDGKLTMAAFAAMMLQKPVPSWIKNFLNKLPSVRFFYECPLHESNVSPHGEHAMAGLLYGQTEIHPIIESPGLISFLKLLSHKIRWNWSDLTIYLPRLNLS